MCEHCIQNGKVDKALAEYYHACSGCGVIPDEEGECNCPPEDYVKPGTEVLMYVNAYEVSRCYGGPEEGGWWYNHLEPIASMPVRGISVAGHTDTCFECYSAREGRVHKETGEKYEECRWGYHLKPIDQARVDMFKAYLEELFGNRREGNIYSVLGGTEVCITLEDHEGRSNPRPHYE